MADLELFIRQMTLGKFTVTWHRRYFFFIQIVEFVDACAQLYFANYYLFFLICSGVTLLKERCSEGCELFVPF